MGVLLTPKRSIQQLHRLPLVGILFSASTLHVTLFGNLFLNCDAWTNSLLFKTKETFKLAEIQKLEADLQTRLSEFSVTDVEQNFVVRSDLTRLVVDRTTGSSLFRLVLQCQDESTDFEMSLQAEKLIRSHVLSLSCLQRCDWVGQVFVEGSDPYELIQDLEQDRVPFPMENGWTLDYVKFIGDTASMKKSAYTMKSLLCAVAHAMPSRPSLTPASAKSRFLFVDIADTSCFLIKCIGNLPKTETKSPLQRKWARRPFQYSSAVNFEAGEIVLEILETLCKRNSRLGTVYDRRDRVLLDPTCGSGTLLALAMAKGFYVEGYDINPRAAQGAMQNIEHVFGTPKAKQYARVEACDSCNLDRSSPSTTIKNISCVVANLPWGRNSKLYVDENERILRSVRSHIGDGTPCAFITGTSTTEKGLLLLFESTGFDVVGQAFVPQRDFLLPVGRKKKKSQTKSDNSEDSFSKPKQNQCVITIVLAKEFEENVRETVQNSDPHVAQTR